jgi:exopolysaccharide biosynthesis protein
VKPITRRPLVLATAVCLALSLLASGGRGSAARGAVAAPSSGRPIVKTTKIAPGLTLTKIIEKKIPRRTFVLTADLSLPITLDVALAGPQLPARKTTGAMAKSAGALAAINGDFGTPSLGRPVHPFAEDGNLVQTAFQQGAMFAVSKDETSVYGGKPTLSVTVTDTVDGRSFVLDHWNDGIPMPGEIAGYSPLGGTLEPSPGHMCSAHLAPAGSPTVSAPDGVDQNFTLDQVACRELPMSEGGGVVISAPPATDEATQLLALTPGTPVRLHWTLGWAGVFDAVGGVPLLVSNGQVAVGACYTAVCARNPRTGIGVTAQGKILLVVVDGRQKRWSLGPTMLEFANIMKSLGAVTALNLDGGGSTTMVVNGKVVNRPSEGLQQKISNAVLVLPGPDPGEQ